MIRCILASREVRGQCCHYKESREVTNSMHYVVIFNTTTIGDKQAIPNLEQVSFTTYPNCLI